MGLFKSSSGIPKQASAGKKQQARAEAWGRIAEQKKKEFGRKSPEFKEARCHEDEEWGKVAEWRAWFPFS